MEESFDCAICCLGESGVSKVRPAHTTADVSIIKLSGGRVASPVFFVEQQKHSFLQLMQKKLEYSAILRVYVRRQRI